MRKEEDRKIAQDPPSKPGGGAALLVRDLCETMIHQNAQEVWLVTTIRFSQATRHFANKKRIRLLSVKELLKVNHSMRSTTNGLAIFFSLGTGTTLGAKTS